MSLATRISTVFFLFAMQASATPGEPSSLAIETILQNEAEAVFAKAAPKVVLIITRQSGEVHAIASGMILTADGYIGTNYHALQGAETVEIRFFANPGSSQDYQSFNTTKLLFSDSQLDIAILKVSSSSLPFLECPSNGCEARIGQQVYAIGNPRGLSNTISQGIVSALRSVDGENMIQHTAAISPGSSGGALTDTAGALLGMNSWQVKDGQSLNFAISAGYLQEALGKARGATVSLRFPPDTVAERSTALEDAAWRAFQSKDYIQARKQAEQAIASGLSSSKMYAILGMAHQLIEENQLERGRKGEGEQYFRQAILMAGPDDEYKQTSRLELLRILAAKVNTSSSKEQLAFIQLADAFLKSERPSMQDQQVQSKMRTWAGSLNGYLESVTGVWTLGRSTSGLMPSLCELGGNFDIWSKGPGFAVFALFPLSGSSWDDPHHSDCSLHGSLVRNGDAFSGVIERSITVGDGGATQRLNLEFKLSKDSLRIEGVAGSGNVDKLARFDRVGANVAAGYLNGAQRGTWRFVLDRVRWNFPAP